MKSTLKFLTYLCASLGVSLFLRPARNSMKLFLWTPKLLGAALSPFIRLTSVFGALLGILRGDWKLVGAGILGAGLANKFITELPNIDDQLVDAFGSERVADKFDHRHAAVYESRNQPTLAGIDFQRDVICGYNRQSSSSLLADLWQPGDETPRSGLGVVYAHGSGWRVGDKDLLTRHLFQRLTSQGHVVLDLAYTLWPDCDLPSMVSEFNQGILWLKENSAAMKINPEGIIAMGASAGGHLALLAAYASGQPEFKPSPQSGDSSVRGVVAFYPPVDLVELYYQAKEQQEIHTTKVDQLAEEIVARLFLLPRVADREGGHNHHPMRGFFVEMMGGTPEETPETYRLLSPIQHVHPDSPPTLLLQGSDDVFYLTPGVRRLHHELHKAGAVSILAEFPHTEHGFDLVLPSASPVARRANREVERFLSLLV
jgi:acetyl esterase/lipase